MALFQEAIVKKYIKQLDQENVDKAFIEFKTIYSESNIKIYKKIKEEAHQGEFIEDIFGKVLGYQRHVDIMREVKNETNAKKADAAILREDNVIGVIELKDNKTKNLTDVQQQAFNYKLNHKNCSYVITSNFHKLRFYIDDTTDYEEFDLYNLDKESFRRFYLYLQREGLLERNLPKLLRQETKFHEEEISKSLYKDYSNFKRSFFENALKNNPQFDKLSLFKKSQKFLDRILFVLFAEDKGLVTTNSVVQIVEKWQALRDDAFDTPRPLYNLVLLFFNNLYLGKKDNKGTVLIPEFGGELFAPDEVLDQLKIDDDVLKDDLLKLSKYDFNTDVDVNILGHIFEHSLNEVDDVEAELRGEQVDKTKSKRKKDGVFYTPKYITKYIVDNTLGKLCSEKKAQLKLDQDIAIFYYQKTDGKLNEKGKDLFERLNTYKSWLLTVKVCDPACGSGAFLNQALSFFIEEHKFVDDLIAELTNSPLRLFDTDLQILENNIYGVDINEESVEIAKLSLWLRTAQPGRKLSNLSNNIKCGNSLIDDPEVAGDKAFNWEKEFPSVFEKGGFDVVIGNPPYVDIKALPNNIVKELFKKYTTAENRINLYSIFIEKGYHITKHNGFLCYINPNSILINSSYSKIRKLLVDEMTTLVKLPDAVFVDASVETIIFEFRKGCVSSNIEAIVYSKNEKISFVDGSIKRTIDKSEWKKGSDCNYDIFSTKSELIVLNKIKIDSKELVELADFSLGITPYDKYRGHSEEIIKSRAFHSQSKENEFYKPLITGENITRYTVSNKINEYINYGDWLGAARDPKFFNDERILIRQIVSGNPPRIYAGYTKESLYYTQIGFGVIARKLSTKYLLCILNSKLITFYHKYSFLDLEKELFQKILIANCKKLPIKEIALTAQQPFIEKADLMLQLSKDLHEQTQKFQSLLNSDFKIEKPSKKIEEFYFLEWSDFNKELQKNKITLLGVSKDDWFDRFERFKKQALELKSQIDQTDKEIDRMVYELYGLTEEEIQIVENS